MLRKNSDLFPRGYDDLERFKKLISTGKPFTFIRFSDGEIEILRNRRLVISSGVTEFRGKTFANNFPKFDEKSFNPKDSQALRADLLASAIYREDSYFKGVPTAHNNAVIDREFMLRLNGGLTSQITFSDLFLNSNFLMARTNFFPFAAEYFSSIFLVGNWRCTLGKYLSRATLLPIPDNLFATYEKTLGDVLLQIRESPKYSLVLSSASSLSNILGHRLRIERPDITFLDIGTALNDIMGLPGKTRAYHKLLDQLTFSEKISAWRYKCNKEYQLKW